jgi:P4 family phage/plasmid primase-like protien
MEHNHHNLSTFYIPITWDDTTQLPTESGFATVEKLLGATKFWKYITECFTVNGTFDTESQKNVYTALESMAFILLKNNAITKSVMYIGSGSNGKSLLLEYIDKLFGKKNITHIPIQEISEGGFVLSRLDGKLANIFADIESTEMRKSGKLKQIIGGEGIEVQQKYQDPYTMYSRAKFIFSANRFPKTYDQTDGFFRRFVVLQWKRKFLDEEKDTHLLETLTTDKREMAKVFQVLVKLAKDIDHQGDFTFTKPINEVRDTWNELADPILMFIQKRLIDSGGSIATKKEVYEDYVRFSRKHEMVPLRIGAFGTEFRNYYEEVTVRDKDTNSVSKYWCDFKIKPEPRQDGAMDKHL